MTVEQKIADMQQASVEQTQASQALAGEVAGKMGEIDAKSAESQQKIDDFIGGGFANKVNSVKEIIVCIDTVNGNDSNTGLSTSSSIKSSGRLDEILGGERYEIVTLYICKGSDFHLEHMISASLEIRVFWATGVGGDLGKPVFRQARSQGCRFRAPYVHINNVDGFTYSAVEGEVLPSNYNNRSMVYKCRMLTLIASNLSVVDNQIFHIHAEGSGDDFHRLSFSMYLSSLRVLASKTGVSNSEKKVVSWYGSIIPLPFDFFVRNIHTELNGIHSNLGGFLNVSETSLQTNADLTMG